MVMEKTNMKEIEKLAESLNECLNIMIRDKEDMNDANWNYQAGVIITGNEAKIVLDTIRAYQKEMEAQKQPAMSLEEVKDIELSLLSKLEKVRNDTYNLFGNKPNAWLKSYRKNIKEAGILIINSELYANQFREEQKWVSVGEEKPKHNDIVLAYSTEDGGQLYELIEVKFKSGLFFSAKDSSYFDVRERYITHWRYISLPEAP